MAKTITQKVIFKGTAVAKLYSMYLDSKHHVALTGGHKAKIAATAGDKFSAWDGHIIGRNLQLLKNKLIVQAWHGSDWDKTDADSTFIMLFEQKGKDAVIHMTHANIPDAHVAGIKKAWTDCYWTPWKAYLASK